MSMNRVLSTTIKIYFIGTRFCEQQELVNIDCKTRQMEHSQRNMTNEHNSTTDGLKGNRSKFLHNSIKTKTSH